MADSTDASNASPTQEFTGTFPRIGRDLDGGRPQEHGPLPELVTTLLVAFDREPGVQAVGDARAVVLRCGGLDVRVGEQRGGTVLTAVFHGVCEGVRAAMEIVPGHGTPAGVRVAVDTTGAGGEPAGSAEQAARLLTTSAPGRIRTSATTALVAGPALPPGVEFVDAGARTPGDRRERIYELVVTGGPGDHGPEPGDAAPSGSNLDWARRAAHGAAPPAGDYPDVVADAWARAEAGQGGALLVSGDTAAARHAATAALALSLHARGALVLHGRWAPGGAQPYRAFRDALGAHAGVRSTEQLTTDLDGRVELCARLVPELGARVPTSAPEPTVAPPPVPAPTPAEAFDAVELWLRAVAGRGPAVLVLTGAEWAEPASVRLLARLAGVAGRLRLLVLVCGPDRVDGADGSWAGFAAATGSTVQRVELPGT